MSEHLVVVGNGMAGLRFVEEVTTRAPGAFRITVIGAEPEPAYNRVLLSSRLAGEIDDEAVRLRSRGWYAVRGVGLVTGTEVLAIDRASRRLTLSCGEAIAYDRLVLATGSEPVRLPLPGAEDAPVATFRDLADVATMAALPRGARAIVIGGGLLGIEAAAGLNRRGVEVTLIHVLDRLMERQLDARAAGLLAEALTAQGLNLVLGAGSRAIERDGAGHALVVDRAGTTVRLPFDLLVFAVGIRPRKALAEAAGLAVGRGILVDSGLATADPAIFAVGECAEACGEVAGLVEPAYAQAAVLARRLAGEPAEYRPQPLATKLKVSGVPVVSAGRFEAEPGDEEIRVDDPDLGLYRKLLVRDGRLAGAILIGDAADGPFYADLIASGRPITPFRADLAFGRAYCEAA